MAHVEQSIGLGVSAVDAYQEWIKYEGQRPFVDALRRIRREGVRLDWRGEVLTIAPVDDAALVSLRIDYDALGGRDDIRRSLAVVARRIRDELARFKAFAEAREAGAGAGWAVTGTPPCA